MRFPSTLALAVILTAACGTTEPRTSILRLSGTVTAQSTGAPVQGADLVLEVPAGPFGFGTRRTITDAAGRYSIEEDFGEPVFCDGMGLSAQASGFVPNVSLGNVRCTDELQVFDFALAPE